MLKLPATVLIAKNNSVLRESMCGEEVFNWWFKPAPRPGLDNFTETKIRTLTSGSGSQCKILH